MLPLPVRVRGAALVLLVLAGACVQRGQAERALEGAEVVHFETTDGVRLEGRLFGDGPAGVVLSHAFPDDQSSWFEFAGTLQDEGYRVLTYNFRGYCPGGMAGCSGGEQDFAEMWRDVTAALDFLLSRGVRRVTLVGASLGGTASLVAASNLALERPVGELEALGGVVTLSAPEAFQGLAVAADQLFKVYAAKLFLAGVGDASAARAAQGFYTNSRSPKRVEIQPTADHGVDLVYGQQAEVVRRLVLDFLARYG